MSLPEIAASWHASGQTTSAAPAPGLPRSTLSPNSPATKKKRALNVEPDPPRGVWQAGQFRLRLFYPPAIADASPHMALLPTRSESRGGPATSRGEPWSQSGSPPCALESPAASAQASVCGFDPSRGEPAEGNVADLLSSSRTSLASSEDGGGPAEHERLLACQLTEDIHSATGRPTQLTEDIRSATGQQGQQATLASPPSIEEDLQRALALSLTD